MTSSTPRYQEFDHPSETRVREAIEVERYKLAESLALVWPKLVKVKSNAVSKSAWHLDKRLHQELVKDAAIRHDGR